MIVIVSHAGDDHAAAVIDVLRHAGHAHELVDTGSFPSAAEVIQRFGDARPRFELVTDGRRVDLGACRVVWWRRPRPYTLHGSIDPSYAPFAYQESHEAMAGLWAGLDATFVNPPVLDEVAHHKPYQLGVATDVGLTVPRTVITNDPEAARAFAQELGPDRTIYKTFVASEDHWRETRILRTEELTMLEQLRLAPAIFQEFIPADADVRVTVMGETVFAVAIRAAPGGYAVDYRMDLERASFEPIDLPAGLVEGLRALMDQLGLVYGAIDLRRTPSGDYVFLEVNPAGEWRFVEERTRQPITRTMADLLASLDLG